MNEIIYKGVGKKIEYLDQLADHEVWISSTFMSRYLMNTYQLTTDQYYSLIIFNDKDYIPECANPECHNKVGFRRLLQGYNITCCDSCKSKLKWLDDNYKARISNSISISRTSYLMTEDQKKLLSEKRLEYYNSLSEFDRIKLFADISYSSLIKNKINSGFFYLLILDNSSFKIGVSKDTIGRLIHIGSIDAESEYMIFEGNYNLLARIEYDIKIKYFEYLRYSYSDKIYGWTEIYDIKYLNELCNYLSKFNLNLVTKNGNRFSNYFF